MTQFSRGTYLAFRKPWVQSLASSQIKHACIVDNQKAKKMVGLLDVFNQSIQNPLKLNTGRRNRKRYTEIP